jgi:hypothetical protein
MSDPSNNPFIGNPFAQGVDKQKRTPPPPAPTAQNPKRSEAGLNKSTTRPPRHPQSPAQGSQSPPSQPSATRGRPPSTASTSATTANSNTQNSHSSTATPATKSTKKTPKKLRRSKAQTTSSPQPAVPPGPPPAYSGSGYKVQVLAKIPLSTNTNLPSRDYLWFAVYPIIPRVGDCIFNNGMYFRVDAVFLYENTAPGWCADIEVSYYPRRR